MKKIIFFICFICLLLILFIFYSNNNDKNSTTNKITLAEVTHSIFYAPLYVAIENGYFEDENIDIDLVLTSGADKVSAAVLSGDAQIGFAGAESAIYVYNQKEKNYLQIIGGLTKRDGQFIVGRNCDENFTLNDLKGKEILVGRPGGMPALNFLNALKNNNIDEKSININYSIDFASLSGAFIGKTGDYVNLFEPNATLIKNESKSCILASIGKLSGEVPYTTFYARKSYIKDNEELIKSFVKAISKGLEYTSNHSAKEIATVIKNQFPDSSISDLENMIQNYKDADTWLNNTHTSEESFKNLEDIMIDNNLLDNYVNFNDLVINYE